MSAKVLLAFEDVFDLLIGNRKGSLSGRPSTERAGKRQTVLCLWLRTTWVSLVGVLPSRYFSNS